MPTVLLAEADRVLRQTYRAYLARHGFRVEAAESAADCLTKLCEFMPDLLILDLELPWGGGDDVLAWLREKRPARRIAVLLTATPAALPDLTEFSEPHVVGYLPKPFTLQVLLESVRSAIARNEGSEPSNLNRVPRYSEAFIE